MAVVLQNYSGNFADFFRVFHLEALYRRRDIVRGATRGSSHQVGMARGWATPPTCEGSLWPPSGSLSVFGKLPGKIRLWKLVSSNSENISCVAFLKHKNSRK
jgi:hypothetical protein